MQLRTLQIISAVYLALVGIGMLVVPNAIVFGALGATPLPGLVAALRAEGGTLVSITVLSWMAREVQPSKVRDAIVVCNVVGYGLVTITGVLGQIAGAPRQALVFAVIHAIFTVLFALVYIRDHKVNAPSATRRASPSA
jgi:hypothetical protein